ncbi:MAG: hypothetical protein KatS3mg111_1952 [Pirellulaceae bacterium]|nr:MAG: hypothetical protein KatS3mg111_1952 [Pirellulaceae bacterium]
MSSQHTRRQSTRSRERWSARSVVIPTVIWALFFASGCGDADWHAETHPAQGRITINGSPPVGAVITLYPTGGKVDTRNSTPWALVEEDGSFTLSTYELGDGAPAGAYKLTVRWPVDVTDMSAALTDRLQGAYSRPERSQWTVTIEEGENQLPPIEITGAKVLAEERSTKLRGGPNGPPRGR